jgi:hypothetical protein
MNEPKDIVTKNNIQGGHDSKDNDCEVQKCEQNNDIEHTNSVQTKYGVPMYEIQMDEDPSKKFKWELIFSSIENYTTNQLTVFANCMLRHTSGLIESAMNNQSDSNKTLLSRCRPYIERTFIRLGADFFFATHTQTDIEFFNHKSTAFQLEDHYVFEFPGDIKVYAIHKPTRMCQRWSYMKPDTQEKENAPSN